MQSSPWSWSTEVSSFPRNTLQSILMLTISFILVAFFINWCSFRWSTNAVCKLILRPVKKWHLHTCSYSCIWYFRHPVLFSLRGSNIRFWAIAALTGKQWVWSIFAHSPVQYVCSNWWHSTMRSSSFRSLHLARLLVRFFPNGEIICSLTAVPWIRAIWLKVAENDTIQKQFSEMVEVSSSSCPMNWHNIYYFSL